MPKEFWCSGRQVEWESVVFVVRKGFVTGAVLKECKIAVVARWW